MLEKIGSIGGIAFLVIAAVVIIFAALMGLKRGIFKSLLRTISLFISAISAFFLVKEVLAPVLEKIGDKILRGMAEGEVVGDMMQSEATLHVIEALVMAFVAPLIFMVVYFMLNKLFYFICLLFNILLKPLVLLEKAIPFHRLIGALISVIGAFVTLAVISAPVGGYAEVLTHTAEHIEENRTDYDEILGAENTDSIVQLKSLTDTLSDSLGVSVPYALGGELLFDRLTSIDVEKDDSVLDETIHTSLEKELLGIVGLLPRASGLADISFDTVETIDIQPLKDVLLHIDDEDSSKVVLVVLTDLFSTASEKWLAEEAYLGINLLGMLEGKTLIFKGAIEVLLDDLVHTHTSTFSGDLGELVLTLENIKTTYVCMMNIKQDVDTGEKTETADVAELIQSLTPKSVEAISTVLPEVMKESSGMEENTALALSEIVIEAFTTLADANENGSMTSEEIDKEAAALNHVLTVGMNAATSMNQEKTDDLVNTIMDSTIIADSVKKNADNENVGQAILDIAPETIDLIHSSIDSYEASNELTEEDAATINALRELFAKKEPIA